MSEEKSAKKVVLEELKAEGIDLAEDLVAGAVKAIFRAIPKLLPVSLAPVAAGVLASLEPTVLALVDKLDGEDDADR